MDPDTPTAITPTTSIIMVGPSGVGKTSLLAAMYEEIDKELEASGCQLDKEPGPTQVAINRRLNELKSLAKGEGIRIQTGEGIVGDAAQRDYIFHLKVENDEGINVTLKFTDLPGGWYTGGEGHKVADELLKSSRVSILAVDATALMEMPDRSAGGLGKHHIAINAPDYIRDSYRRASLPEGHIVILALIRAETYVRNGKTQLLQENTRKAYRELAATLEKKKIPLVGCHVETVGCLFFNSFLEKDGNVESHFIRDKDIGYRPNRCAIPLRLAAGEAMVGALDAALLEVVKNDNFWNWLGGIFGMETALSRAKKKVEAIYGAYHSIASRVKDDDFFEIEP
jgi:hypothetical protein